jgi:hypothetical protein
MQVVQHRDDLVVRRLRLLSVAGGDDDPNGAGRGNVAQACREAGISRNTAYKERNANPAFAAPVG